MPVAESTAGSGSSYKAGGTNFDVWAASSEESAAVTWAGVKENRQNKSIGTAERAILLK